MKALTVQQPWAWAIIHGGKDIENRTTLWKHRGPLAIHAGQRFSERGAKIVPEIYMQQHGITDGFGLYLGENLLGAIIGTVNVVDIHIAHPETHAYGNTYAAACCQSPWAETQYVEHGGRLRRQLVHLVLEDPRPCEPIDCKGALGLWDVPDDIARIIHPREGTT